MGKPVKPTALKLLHGHQKSRIPKGEPIPAAGAVEPPAHLSPAARAIWDQLAPDLIHKGVLTPWDVHLFGLYCTSLVYAAEAESQLDEAGVLVRARNRSDRSHGVKVRNAALSVYRDMSEMSLKLGRQFGLTPADRIKLATGEPRDEMAGEHLLTGHYTRR